MPRQPVAPSAPRCRRRGSARRRSPSGCRASRRRCSRAKAPRRPRTSRSWRGRRRRIPPGWSGRTRRARPSPRRSRSGSARRSGASRGRAARPARRRSGGTGRGSSRTSSSRPVAPKLALPPGVRSISATRRARAASLLPSAISAETSGVRKAASASGRGRRRPGGRSRAATSGCRRRAGRGTRRSRSAGSAARSRRAGPRPRALAAQPDELAQALGRGRHPGQAVGGELVGLERGVRRCRPGGKPGREAVAGGGDQPRGGFGGRGAAGQELGDRRRSGRLGGGRLRSLAVSSGRFCAARNRCCGCAQAKGKFGKRQTRAQDCCFDAQR